MTSGVASSDRRINNHTGGPGFWSRIAQARTAANSKTSGPHAPSRTFNACHAPAGRLAATAATESTPARVRAVGLRPLPEYAGTHPAGSSVHTVVEVGTSRTYFCPSSSIASWKCPALPYSSSATTQSRVGLAENLDAPHQLGGDPGLGCEGDILGNVGLLAPREGLGRLLAPGPGQVEPVVQQGRAGGG